MCGQQRVVTLSVTPLAARYAGHLGNPAAPQLCLSGVAEGSQRVQLAPLTPLIHNTTLKTAGSDRVSLIFLKCVMQTLPSQRGERGDVIYL